MLDAALDLTDPDPAEANQVCLEPVLARAVAAGRKPELGGNPAQLEDMLAGFDYEIARASLTRMLSDHGLRSARIQELWQDRERTRTATKLGARVGHASGVWALVSALELSAPRRAL